MLQALDLYGSSRRADRLNAPPLLIFRSTPVISSEGKKVVKGHLEFCGVGIIERLEMVIQREAAGSRTFPNLVIDLVVTDLTDRDDAIDFRWLDNRGKIPLSALRMRFAMPRSRGDAG